MSASVYKSIILDIKPLPICPEKIPPPFAGNYPRLSHNGFVLIFLSEDFATAMHEPSVL